MFPKDHIVIRVPLIPVLGETTSKLNEEEFYAGYQPPSATKYTNFHSVNVGVNHIADKFL